MAQGRYNAAAAVLPDGKVLVAGGLTTAPGDSARKTAELYDPATNAWTANERTQLGMCMLPSGRVAVMGGLGANGEGRKDCEAFDLVTRTWGPLPEMPVALANMAAAPVAGGMIAVGGGKVELFDEGSGRWLTLPHQTEEPRLITQLVSLQASALQAAGAGH